MEKTIEIDPTFMLAVMNGIDVVLLEEEDYCCTSSTKNNQLFRGNLYFHELLERSSALDNNNNSCVQDEDDACQAILQGIKDRGGRFLMVNERTRCLYVLSDGDALEQIRHAFCQQNRDGGSSKNKKSKRRRGKSCNSKKKKKKNKKTKAPEKSYFPVEPSGSFA